jgi:pyruvate,water dikinase
MWSNANLKEVLDPVPTMLSWSIMKGGISRILFDAQLAAGMTVPEGMPLLRRFAGRPYFDISALQWAAWDCFGLPPAQYNRLLGGSQPEIALPADPAQARRDGRRRAGYRLRLVRALWGLQRRLRPWSESIQGRSRAVRRTGLSGLSAAELVALTKAWQVELLSYPIQLANCAAGAWLDMAHQIATPRLGAEAAHALVSGLMAGLGAVTSAEHGYRLQALARRKGSPTFTAELQEFLDRYGHRGFGECELANRRWDEDPAALTALLDALATTSRDRAAAEGVRREAEGGLGSLGPLAQRLVRWAAGKAQAGYALREEAKSTLVAVLGVLRAFALETGRRMVAAGVLDTAEAVFDLSAVDLQVWLDGDWDGRGAAILAADHRARRREWLALPPPADVLMEQGGGGPEPAPAVAAGSTRPGEWQGLAASPGRVEAPACILADPTEAARLSPGGILVARATDPGWTPLFLVAGGVVAETGGYLSHSAIVAREFGLPAVVNLPGILSAVTHGETLVVDGDRGRVEGRVS